MNKKTVYEVIEAGKNSHKNINKIVITGFLNGDINKQYYVSFVKNIFGAFIIDMSVPNVINSKVVNCYDEYSILKELPNIYKEKVEYYKIMNLGTKLTVLIVSTFKGEENKEKEITTKEAFNSQKEVRVEHELISKDSILSGYSTMSNILSVMLKTFEPSQIYKILFKGRWFEKND